MTQVFSLTQTDQPIFENVFATPNLLINHVIIEPGKIFPKHPTDADVYALVLRGSLALALENEEPQTLTQGQGIHIPKGLVSELGNRSDALVELFVVKHML